METKKKTVPEIGSEMYIHQQPPIKSKKRIRKRKGSKQISKNWRNKKKIQKTKWGLKLRRRGS